MFAGKNNEIYSFINRSIEWCLMVKIMKFIYTLILKHLFVHI